MGIARAAFIIMLGNMASRLLGVVREEVIAGLFGLTDAADAFTLASRVTTPVYDLLIGGMISAALIPVFSDYIAPERKEELWRLVSIVLNLVFSVFAVVVVIFIIFAPQLMGVYGHGFEVEKQVLAVDLLRVMLSALILMGISGVLTALLYSRQSFGLPALCGSVYNAAIVVIALLFHQRLGVSSLALGVLIGAVLQVMVQLPGLRGMRYQLGMSLSHSGVRRIMKLYFPVALGLVVSAIGVTIDSNLASRTGGGSMAAMRYATTLTQLPLGLVATAMSFAILLTLSRYSSGVLDRGGILQADAGEASDMPVEVVGQESAVGSQPSFLAGERMTGDIEASSLGTTAEVLAAYKRTLVLGIKMMVIIILPATVGLVVLREPIIRLLFQHGVFDAEGTSRTALAFLCYSPGLPAAAIDQLLIFSFYARKNTVAPVLEGVGAVLIYIAVAATPLGPLSMPRLALANSAQWTSHALMMVFLLWRAVGSLRGFALGTVLVKALSGSLTMGVVLLLLGVVVERRLNVSGIGSLAAYLVVTIGLGVVFYGLALMAMRVEETRYFWQMIRVRLGR